MKELNLTQGSVPKVLLQFAVPFLIANVLQALYGGADLFVVGQYDDSLQANVIGRIAVIKEYRGKKVGQYIVQSACSLIQGNVCLHAQLQAKPFYEKLGFKAYGEIDCDEFCPHTWMKKEM